MKTLIVLLVGVCSLAAQIQNIPNTTSAQVRTLLNSNFSYVNTQLGLKAALSHAHIVSDVTGLQAALDGKSSSGHNHDLLYAQLSHVHVVADVTGLQTALDGKASTSHNHDATYAALAHVHLIEGVTGLQTALDGKAATDHNHDSTYAPIAKGVTNGDSHDHNGGDGGQIAHGNLSGIGTNTHAQIDTALTTAATHQANTSNPHSVTKAQVGLGSVPNTDATARANHTGSQLASTISDFSTAALSAVKREIGFAMCANTNCAAADTITIPRNISAATAGTLTKCSVRVGTAPTGSSLTVDVKKNGTTTATVTLTSGSSTGNTTTFISATLAEDDYLIPVITAVGSSVTGKDLHLICTVQ